MCSISNGTYIEQGNNNSTDRNATADDVANSNAAKLLQPDDDENLDGVDLMERFEIDIQKAGRFFQRAINDTGIISTGSHFHISDLPVEIIFYILKWVVSSDLDLRSLDTCSAVSKGFYICAKDPDIWRLACVKYVCLVTWTAAFPFDLVMIIRLILNTEFGAPILVHRNYLHMIRGVKCFSTVIAFISMDATSARPIIFDTERTVFRYDPMDLQIC